MTHPFQVIPGGQPPDAERRRSFMQTDTGNAERLIARHGGNLRYVPQWDRWLIYDGKRWRPDTMLEIQRLAKDTVRAMWVEVKDLDDKAERKDLVKHVVMSENASKLRALVERARSEQGITIEPDSLNTDPWLLVVENGTIDLRTGQLRPHSRDDLVTKIAPVAFDASARCDRWEAFLDRIMNGNGPLIRFLQRAVGYSLTGVTSEQVLFFLYGAGANGKSTFLEVVRSLLDEYATQADFTTFIERKGDGPRNDIARLYGARLVTSSEVGEGKRLNESLVKTLTGSDVIAARYLYAETFEFRPTFKLWLAANHRPVIRGTDAAIWRRIRLVPFAVAIPEDERDPKLAEDLKAELPGILAWAVAGCVLWQRDGLGAPSEVMLATDAYRRDSDTLGAFIDECCVIETDAAVPAGELYAAYSKWAGDGGEFTYSQTRFGRELEDRGFTSEKRGSQSARLKWRVGLKLSAPKDMTPTWNRPPSNSRPIEAIANDQKDFDY